MPRRAPLSLLAAMALAGLVRADVATLIQGDVRVQALSPTLVRLEVRGPKGFEDRPTFRVLQRDWPGVQTAFILSPTADDVTSSLTTPDWAVYVAPGAKSLAQVFIVGSDGTRLYAPSGKESSRAWLPAPAKTPRAWAFADAPRLIPPAWGATPAPNADPTSGWDLSNDATDLYVFLPNRSYSRLRGDFLRLTGPVEMPPLYMLGLIDSKYHPYTAAEALDRVDQYHKRRIPLDVLTIDTDWRIGGSHGYTPNPTYFPDMPGFLQKARAKGVRIMFNDHPEPQAPAALDPKEMTYRYDGLTRLMREGVDVWWYDRNWGVSLNSPAEGLRHEVWGMRVYHDTAERFRPGERPAIMTNVDGIDNGIRNNPPDVATHRFPVQWTGDTSARWAYLRRGVENAVQGGVEGLNPWINEDLGGHIGAPSPELYVRYMQYGALAPVMRPHCTRDQERAPWAFGPEAERIVTDAVRLRYRLLPLLYASAREAYDQGEPIVRRLDLDYPTFKEAARDDQYLLGHDLLVVPIVDGGPAVLPAAWTVGPWKAQYWNNEELKGDPILQREEQSLGFDLTWDPVAPGVPADRFSARWSGTIRNPGKEPMRIVTTSDDGVRVWIDGRLALDKWGPQNSVSYDVPVLLAPGKAHAVRVEYQEIGGGQTMRLGLATTGRTRRRDLWVPPGTWTELGTGRRFQGPKTAQIAAPLNRIPMYVRAGGLIPTVLPAARTDEIAWNGVRLEAFAGADGTATLYEDDGHSTGYRADAYRRTAIAMQSNAHRTVVSIAPTQGAFPGAVASRIWTLRLHLAPGQKASGVQVDGRPAAWRSLRRDSATSAPFGSARVADADVIEVALPVRSVTKAAEIEVATR